MKQISVNNLLGVKYLTKDDINLIFETADSFKEILNRKIKKVPTLTGITIANLFFESINIMWIKKTIPDIKIKGLFANIIGGTSIQLGENVAPNEYPQAFIRELL